MAVEAYFCRRCPRTRESRPAVARRFGLWVPACAGKTAFIVSLSEGEQTAEAVGRRHGRPVVLRVAAGRMHRDGYAFYRSENGVWLAESVPALYVGVL